MKRLLRVKLPAAAIVLFGGAAVAAPAGGSTNESGTCEACTVDEEACYVLGDYICRAYCGPIFYAVGCTPPVFGCPPGYFMVHCSS